MKKTFLVLAALALVGVGAWYFIQKAGSSTRLSAFVPAESDLVINLDLVSLFKKADLANAEKRTLVQALIEKHGDTASRNVLAQLLGDPGSSGIRFNDQAFLFFRNTNTKNINNAGLLLGIKSIEDFENMLRKIDPNAKIQKEGDITFWAMPAGSVLMWDSKTALLYKGPDVNANLLNARSILAKETPTLKENKLFKKAYVKGHDIHAYVNYGNLISRTPGASNIMSLEGGMAYGAGFSFVDGEVKVENKVAFESSKDARWMDMYRQTSAGHSLDYTLNEVPLMAVQVQVNTEKLYEVLMQSTSTKEALEEMATELQLKPEEVLSMFNGTVSFGFSGFEKQVVVNNFFGTESREELRLPKAALFLGVKNQDHFQKLLDRVGQKPENGKYTLQIPFIGTFYLVQTEAGLSIMMLESMADQLAKDKTFGVSDYGEAGKYLSANANAGYINLDLESMPPSFISTIKEAPFYSLVETGLKPLDHLEFKQDKKRGFSRLLFKNKEQNSLIQLLDLADAIYVKYEELEAKQEMEAEEEYEEMIEVDPDGITVE